jgi:hypothetical protein
MAVKQLGKKSMFLTFISIAIIAAAIIIFTPSDINLRKDIPVIKTRVSNVNEYVLDLENVYLERTLHASGTKTIIALTRYMTEETISTGVEVFFSNVEGNPLYFQDVFSEVLLEGKIGGVDIDDYYPETIMSGNNYDDWLSEIKTTAESTFNIGTVYGISDIRIYQTKPWFVDVEADVSFNVSSETASWNKTATIKTEIEIEGFHDPYYLVKTGGLYKSIINKSGTKFDEWEVEKVKDFIKDGNYTHFENSQAPSFIMRFTDDMSTSDCCGIESLVNPNKLNAPYNDRALSYVDYKFFPSWQSPPLCSEATPTLYIETDIQSEFYKIKFDFNDLARYKIRDDPLADVQQECPPPETP